MESEIETTTVVTLKLSEDEALWLRGLMQNPFYDYEKPEDEPEDMKHYRQVFFNAVKGVG